MVLIQGVAFPVGPYMDKQNKIVIVTAANSKRPNMLVIYTGSYGFYLMNLSCSDYGRSVRGETRSPAPM